jgi:D-3-phosphoglycerate dehydrogenase
VIPPIETYEEGQKVLLLEGIHPDAAARFRDAGFEVQEVAGSLAEEELVERLVDVRILGIRSKTQLTRAAVEAANRLSVVGAFCIGTNQIDLKACLARGVAVFNAPFANTRSVVEMALGEIIVLFRDLFEKSDLLHRGIWKKSAKGAREIRGRRLGIVGSGDIGSQLSVVAEAVGMEVRFYDVAEKLALGNARPCVSL